MGKVRSILSLVGVAPSNQYICWASTPCLDANRSDEEVIATHGLFQALEYWEVLAADSHYPYANFMCTRRPERDAIDLVVNQVISSIKTPVERRFGILKEKFPAFRFGWYHSRDFLNNTWTVMMNALNFILQFDVPPVNINNFLFLETVS